MTKQNENEQKETKVITSLRNINAFLNEDMLNEIGWSEVDGEKSFSGLELRSIATYDDKINEYKEKLSTYWVYRDKINGYEFKIMYLTRLRGFAHLEQGKPAKALKDFKYLQRLNALDMKYREMSFFSGVAYVGIGSFGQAIVDFESYLEKNKISPDVSFWLGVAYCGKNNFNNAIKHFDSAIKDDPTFEEAYLARAEAYFKSGDWSKAEDDFSKALELNPKNVEVKNNLLLIKDIKEKFQKLQRNLDERGKA